MFASKARAALLQGWLLALAANMRLGWERITKTNPLAYFAHRRVTEKKKFCNFGHSWSIDFDVRLPKRSKTKNSNEENSLEKIKRANLAANY